MQPLVSNPLGVFGCWELEATEVHTHEQSVFLNTCVHGFENQKFNVVWHFGFKHPRLVNPLVFLIPATFPCAPPGCFPWFESIVEGWV